MGFVNITKQNCPYSVTLTDGRAKVHILVEDTSTCPGKNLTSCIVSARVEGVEGWLDPDTNKGIMPYSFRFYNLDGQYKGGTTESIRMSASKTSTSVYVFNMWCNIVQPAWYKFDFIYHYKVSYKHTTHATFTSYVGSIPTPSSAVNKPPQTPLVVVDPLSTVINAPINITFNFDAPKYYIFPNGKLANLPVITTSKKTYVLKYNTKGIYTPEFGALTNIYNTMHTCTIVITEGSKPVPPLPNPPTPTPEPQVVECKSDGDKNLANYTFNVIDKTIYDVIWDFGDGETSTERNVRHTYKRSGRYIPSVRYKRK